MRLEWGGEGAPELGDIACQTSVRGADDCDLVRRAYRVVGIEEGAKPDRYRLVMERVAYGTRPDPPALAWSFYNMPRRA